MFDIEYVYLGYQKEIILNASVVQMKTFFAFT